jgi:hypothetical protein
LVRQETPAFSIHTFTLSPDVVKTLRRLSWDASDSLGWPISSSAIVRALVRQADQQSPAAIDALFRLVEKDLQDGVRGGKQQ